MRRALLLILLALPLPLTASEPEDPSDQESADWAAEAAASRAVASAHLSRVVDRLSLRRDAQALALRVLIEHLIDVWANMEVAADGGTSSPLPLKTEGALPAIADIDRLDLDTLWLLHKAAASLGDANSLERIEAELRVRDAGNLASYLPELAQARETLTATELDARLEDIAKRAARFEQYWGSHARLFIETAESVAPSVELIAMSAQGMVPRPADFSAEREARIVTGMLGVTNLFLVPFPQFQGLTESCNPRQNSESLSAIRQNACLRLGRMMSEHSDSILGEMVGLRIWHQQVADTPEAAEVIERRRRYHWRQEAYVEQLRELDDWNMTERSLEHLRRGEGEREGQEALLLEAGISLQPPDEYVPLMQDWDQAFR